MIGLSDSSAAIDYGRSTAVNVSDTAAIRLGESTASGRVGVGGIAEGGVTDPTLTPNGYQAPPQGKHGPDISSGIKSKWLRKPKSSRSKQRMLEHAMHAASHKQQHALRLTRRVPVTAGMFSNPSSCKLCAAYYRHRLFEVRMFRVLYLRSSHCFDMQIECLWYFESVIVTNLLIYCYCSKWGLFSLRSSEFRI